MISPMLRERSNAKVGYTPRSGKHSAGINKAGTEICLYFLRCLQNLSGAEVFTPCY